MIFVMVPILPAEAAGLEDTERVEILELVESYMDSRETAVMTGDTESLRTVAVNGIVNDENTQPALKAVSCTDIATGAGGFIVTGYVKWVPHCVQKMVIPHRIFCCIITLIAGSYPAH